MLSKEYLKKTLLGLDEFSSGNQFLEGNGYDSIIEILKNLRSVEFPVIVFEDKVSGSIALIEGPVDTYTQSIWVMGQEGRSDDSREISADMGRLAYKILAKLLDEYRKGAGELKGWQYQRILYMKRSGGPNSRGWEIVLSFKDDFSMINE